MGDILTRSDGFRLSVDPTPDDVSEANWLIDRQGAEIERLRSSLDALDERRATFCLAMPGSDEEFAAWLAGFDSAVEIVKNSVKDGRDDG